MAVVSNAPALPALPVLPSIAGAGLAPEAEAQKGPGTTGA